MDIFKRKGAIMYIRFTLLCSLFLNLSVLADHPYFCVQKLSRSPYCLSIANSELFAENLGCSDEILDMVTGCLDSVSEDMYIACLGGYSTTTDEVKSKSLCELYPEFASIESVSDKERDSIKRVKYQSPKKRKSANSTIEI